MRMQSRGKCWWSSSKNLQSRLACWASVKIVNCRLWCCERVNCAIIAMLEVYLATRLYRKGLNELFRSKWIVKPPQKPILSVSLRWLLISEPKNALNFRVRLENVIRKGEKSFVGVHKIFQDKSRQMSTYKIIKNLLLLAPLSHRSALSYHPRPQLGRLNNKQF